MNSEGLIFLLAPLLGWFAAHLVKFFLALVISKGKDVDPRIFLRAGGMPSSHTAVMIATITVIGALEGVYSAIFGVSAAVTAIIIYDALNVRRSVGEQAEVLRRVAPQQKFYIAHGHTFTEVIGGAVVGLFVGWLLLQIL